MMRLLFRFMIYSNLFLLFSCTHVAEKEVLNDLLTDPTQGKFESPDKYEEALGLRDFDNSRDHSIFAYPLTQFYPLAYKEFLLENPAIDEFIKKKDSPLEKCFYIRLEARELGRDEVDLENWEVWIQQEGDREEFSFVERPGVSPRKSVKRRVTQRGREIWWISETYACAEKAWGLDRPFSLYVNRVGREEKEPYILNWLVY